MAQFASSCAQAEKRAADSKRAAFSRRGKLQPVLPPGSSKGFHLAYGFAKQSACDAFCKRFRKSARQ
jgi:hypothetical protein